jgi:hypothetical protein
LVIEGVRPLALVLGAALGLLLLGCSRSRPDFGTLPRVEVPIEKQPEQDPTLFQEDEPKVAPTDLPDPAPLRMAEQVDYQVEFQKGELKVTSTKLITLKEPESTARRPGRFALELWAGSDLVERVRFDFPLLAASSSEEEDAFESGLTSQTTVRVPRVARAQTARILDRKKRTAVRVIWPPEEPPASETAPQPGPIAGTRQSGETDAR